MLVTPSRPALPTGRLRVRRVAPPAESRLAPLYPGADLADAFAVGLPEAATGDIGRLAEVVLGRPSTSFRALLALRDLLVAPLGLRTSREARRRAPGERRIFIFRVLEQDGRELIVGSEDRHRLFRMTVLVRAAGMGDRELVVGSVVRCRDRLGRVYLAVIRPFHVLVVRGFLSRATRDGWPGDG